MKRITALFVLALLALVSIYTVVSAAEKGGLAAFADAKSAEASLSESVPFREELVELMTKIRYISGVRTFGDITIGGDGSLLRDMAEPAESKYKSACAQIGEFAGRSMEEDYLVLIPTSAVIRQQEVSAYTAAGFFNQRRYINDIYESSYSFARTVDVYQSLFNHRDEYIYYHTEELPTGLGGYYIYKSIAERMGLEPKELADFSVAYVRQSFCGALAQPAIQPYAKADFISLYEYTGYKTKKTVTHYGADGSTDYQSGIYSYADHEDATDAFFGGLSAVTEIASDAENGKSVLVFCDSTAKSWVPFITLHYERVILADVSAATAEQLAELSAGEYDKIIFAYSAAAFADTDFSKLNTVAE